MALPTSFFLWPKANFPRSLDYVAGSAGCEKIEARLAQLFPGSVPVLFSSARAAINAVLEHIGLTRPDFLWLPEFSSHCVLDTVAHVCTPTPVMGEKINAAIVYHQWGFEHQAEFYKDVVLLEDSVDSLFIPGTSPFAIGGRYAFWSLPKVLGTLAGGVVFCQFATDASALRHIRSNRPDSYIQAALRLASYSSRMASLYWNGAESQQGGLIAPFRRQIWRALEEIEQTVEERMGVLKQVLGEGADAFTKSGRLPSNLPLTIPEGWEKLWAPEARLSAGLRYFNTSRTCPQSHWAKVAPLPVHRDISQNVIAETLSTLNLEEGQIELAII